MWVFIIFKRSAAGVSGLRNMWIAVECSVPSPPQHGSPNGFTVIGHLTEQNVFTSRAALSQIALGCCRPVHCLFHSGHFPSTSPMSVIFFLKSAGNLKKVDDSEATPSLALFPSPLSTHTDVGALEWSDFLQRRVPRECIYSYVASQQCSGQFVSH